MKTVLKYESPQIIGWLESSIEYSRIKSNSLKISNFLPKFDHYIGIVWKIGIIRNFPFKSFISEATTVDEINNNVNIWNTYPQIYQNSENGFTEINRKKLFKMFNIQYHEYKNDFNLPWNSRAIRVLQRKIVEDLSILIDEINQKNELFLYWEDYYRFGIEDNLFKITKDEYLHKLEETRFDVNFYLFPENRNWCLVNLEDLGFNIFAYNSVIKNDLKSFSKIETFDLTSESEIYGQ